MVVRRSPFSDNPRVGTRGQQRSEQILEATRTVLGRNGYRRTSVEEIAREADCSRATFYQYFADKEAAFAQLSEVVAADLQEVAAALGPISADAAGWRALRDWVDAYAAVYDGHEAVFNNFAAAAMADAVVARQLRRGGRHHQDTIGRRVVDADLSDDVLDAVVGLATPTLVRVLDDASTLRRAGVRRSRRAVLDAYVDVVHRTLFGVAPSVNVRDHGLRSTSTRRTFRTDDAVSSDGVTRRTLTTAARQVLVDVGFHGATVDAIAAEAGVAHGTFYRYFPNIESLTRELVADASDKLSVHFAELAEILTARSTGDADLRKWLKRYTRAQADEMSILRVWSDAALADSALLADAAPMLEWGRRRVAGPLEGRGFGGEQVDAVILIALIDGLGAAARPPATLDAAAVMIERGVLGTGGPAPDGNAISV